MKKQAYTTTLENCNQPKKQILQISMLSCRNKHGALTLSLSKIILYPSFSSTPRTNFFTSSHHVSEITNMPISFNPSTTQFRYLHNHQSQSLHLYVNSISTSLSNQAHVFTFPSHVSKITRYVHNYPLSKSSQSLDLYVNSISSLLSNQTLLTTSIDDLLKDYKNKLSSTLVEQVLLNYRQIGRVRTLEFFSWAGLQMGFRFDDCLVEYVADFLGRRKLFDDLKCLLVTIFAHKGKISCRAVSICIRFLGRQGRVKEALCLFEEMESEFKCKPNNLVFNNILYVLCKKETSGALIDIAFDIFRRIESPDTFSYSNILVGLCKFGRFKMAIDVFREMGRAKLVPTRSAVNIFLGELCSLSAKEGETEKIRVINARRPFTILVPNVGSKNGAIKPAVGVFWACHNMGLLPSSFIINKLITELSRLGQMEESVLILTAIEKRKLACLPEIYSIVIQGLCTHRMVEPACDLFDKILAKGLKPKLVVYNCMICTLCKNGNISDAENIFKIMNKSRCLPDNVTYTALIHGYGEANNCEDAYDLLMEMLGLGWLPHFHTYSLVNKLLKENEKIDLSVKLEKKVETQMLHKLCKMGRLEEAYEKLASMLEREIFPPIYMIDEFRKTFQKYGKGNVARGLLEKLDSINKIEDAEMTSC